MPQKQDSVKVVGIKASTLALFQGTFGAVIGFVAAVLFAFRATIHLTQSTESLLGGLTFGLSAGIVSVVVMPFVYFALGWVTGYIQGWVFNWLARSSGGIEILTEK